MIFDGILAKYRRTDEWNGRFATGENGEIRLSETGSPCPAQHRWKKTLITCLQFILAICLRWPDPVTNKQKWKQD